MKNESIGTRIGRLRDAKNLSQEQLAKALDVSREKVKSWENNERQIKAGDITKLADFFSVSADYILGRSDVASPSADVQAVCAFTKLSDIAVGNLTHPINGKNVYIGLNNLLGRPAFFTRCAELGALRLQVERFQDVAGARSGTQYIDAADNGVLPAVTLYGKDLLNYWRAEINRRFATLFDAATGMDNVNAANDKETEGGEDVE